MNQSFKGYFFPNCFAFFSIQSLLIFVLETLHLAIPCCITARE